MQGHWDREKNKQTNRHQYSFATQYLLILCNTEFNI